MKSLARAVALALLLVVSLSGMTAAAGACDHRAAASGSHDHHPAPNQAPCDHDQPAVPCAAMPACTGATLALSAPLGTISPAAVVVVVAASPTESLSSFSPAGDVPPPRS